MLIPHIVGERHYRVAQEIKRTMAEYDELKDIIAMLGIEELSQEDRKTVHRARRIERYLTQPFFTTEQFTGQEGKLVSREDAIEGFERILNDEFEGYSERTFYMIGTIDEAQEKHDAAQKENGADNGVGDKPDAGDENENAEGDDAS
jgi:F-type H+-transporting ATPase subunit beta